MKKTILALCVGLLCPFASAHADGLFGDFDFGSWFGGSSTSNSTIVNAFECLGKPDFATIATCSVGSLGGLDLSKLTPDQKAQITSTYNSLQPSGPIGPGEKCYTENAEYYRAQRYRGSAETEYYRRSNTYDRQTDSQQRAILRQLMIANQKDGELTALLLQMGVEAITGLTNKLTCPPPTKKNDPIATFCNKNKGRFWRLANQYARAMGAKTTAIKRVASVQKTTSLTVKLRYNRAVIAYNSLVSKINMELTTYNRFRTCEGWGATSLTPCPGGGDNCPVPPDPPLQVTKDGGCISLLGLGDLCSNSLVTDILGKVTDYVNL